MPPREVNKPYQLPISLAKGRDTRPGPLGHSPSAGSLDQLIKDFIRLHADGDGFKLATILSPVNTREPSFLKDVWASTSYHAAKSDIKEAIVRASSRSKLSHDEAKGWTEVFLAYWKTLGELLALDGTTGYSSSWTKVYEAWKELTIALIRGYTNHGFEAWTVPCLYLAGKYLRLFAIQSDKERNDSSADIAGAAFQDDLDPETERHQQLRDCEQQLKRIFTLCLSDRTPLEESRKWGIYYVINLLFKTYFKLNSASLSRTILKTLTAYQGDMPPLNSFPKSQRVTFKYYEGVLFFLEENYAEAETHLTEAWQLCHKDALTNQEKILTYLIPCHLLTTHTLPSSTLLKPFPRLQKLFLPFDRCIRKGDLREFDLALRDAEDELVRRRIYLTLERGRDIALRNLLRKVFLAGGFEEAREPGTAPIRRTRVPVTEFRVAISLMSGEEIDADEVECLLANMIYKNLMKGYIARDRGIVVLSKSGAFPGTGI